jgi:hypothetical protein
LDSAQKKSVVRVFSGLRACGQGLHALIR